MSDSIIQLLRLEKPNAADWLAQLPQMAATLEENLYFSANSVDEYVDVTTLNARLQQLGDPALQEKHAGSNDDEGNSEDRSKKVLMQKQQRLLLLRHASACKNDVDCKVTPLCSTIKVLWKHLAKCKEPKCDTQHCMSSRYVLSHYSKCKDEACSVCGPVRADIRKSLSKRASSQAHAGGSGHLDAQPMTKRVKLEEGVACSGQERADKEKLLRRHLALLVHSPYCDDSTSCKEKHNCSKMKVSCHISFIFICLPSNRIIMSVRTTSCTCGTARRRTRAAIPVIGSTSSSPYTRDRVVKMTVRCLSAQRSRPTRRTPAILTRTLPQPLPTLPHKHKQA